MDWQAFQQAADRYEQWYATRHGRRAALAERLLLKWLLSTFRGTRSILEVGCGTGHFTGWLAESGYRVTGLDRAPAMIEQARCRLPSVAFVEGDAHELPFPKAAFDVVVYVTTLEFLDRPSAALEEAVRVARQGVVAIALNRRSLGALGRRFRLRSRRRLLANAHDYSLHALRRALRDAAGPRLRSVQWSSTLFPENFWALRARLPLGNVLGAALQLAPEPRFVRSPSPRAAHPAQAGRWVARHATGPEAAPAFTDHTTP